MVRAQVRMVMAPSPTPTSLSSSTWLWKADAKQIFFVHGEKESLQGFKGAIEEKLAIDAHVALWKETVTV